MLRVLFRSTGQLHLLSLSDLIGLFVVASCLIGVLAQQVESVGEYMLVAGGGPQEYDELIFLFLLLGGVAHLHFQLLELVDVLVLTETELISVFVIYDYTILSKVIALIFNVLKSQSGSILQPSNLLRFPLMEVELLLLCLSVMSKQLLGLQVIQLLEVGILRHSIEGLLFLLGEGRGGV